VVPYLKDTKSDYLIRTARANREWSEQLVARAKAIMARAPRYCAKPQVCIRDFAALRNEVGNDPSVPAGIKNWLLAIASIIKDWPTMPKEEIGSTTTEATPAEAAAYIVDQHVPNHVRSDVLRALPRLTPYSFHYAAWQIRHAAFRMYA